MNRDEEMKLLVMTILEKAEQHEWRLVLEMLRRLNRRLQESPADIHNNYN